MTKTTLFTYDNNGNILKRREFNFTLKDINYLEELDSTDFTYIYNGDKLISYNGESFAYDVIGNPTTYRGKTLTWAKGRQLTNFNGVTFAYNGKGQRISKNNIKYTYDSNGKLIYQTDGTNSLGYYYDATGVCAIRYNNRTFGFRKNTQGDIIAIYNAFGEILARYTYDAWGNHTVTDVNGNDIINLDNIAHLNPFRYRGYYYDTETDLYYLQSRYYDPDLGRFINADTIEYLNPETINGLNLYCYCMNNPIMYADPSGHSAILIGLIIGAVIGAAIGFGTAAYMDYQDDGQVFNGSVEWYDYLGATVLGGAIGAGIGAGIGYIAPQIGSALSAFAGTSFTIGGGLSISASGVAAVSAGFTITGAQILQGAGILSGITITASIIGKSGGYTVKKFSNEHNPPHVHIYGDDILDKAHGIRIGLDGNPLPGEGKLPPGARKALKKLWELILKALSK